MNPHLSPQIRGLLEGLRWRIRAYVWAEGLALAIAAVGLIFWLALALDYAPVLLGASEMPQGVRLLILLAAGALAAVIIYWYILRRAFVELPDRSMALLLERKHADFHDSLLTSVEMGEEAEHASSFSEEMLEHTSAEAQASLNRVDPNRVFNFYPLMRNIGLALLAIVSIAIFAFSAKDAFATAFSRLVGLSEEPWPRKSSLDVVGIEVTRPIAAHEVAEGQPAHRITRIPFPEDRVLKVAKGTDVRIIVRSEGPAQDLPDYCSIFYSTQDVSFASVTMREFGPERQASEGRGLQEYLADTSPFKKMLGSISFDVLGYGRSESGSALGSWPVTNRARGYRLEVVESPTLAEVWVFCRYPDYSGKFADLRKLTASMVIPQGAEVTLYAVSNKPLAAVGVQTQEGETSKSDTAPVGPRYTRTDAWVADLMKGLKSTSPPPQDNYVFEYRLDRLMENAMIDVTLTDTDGVQNLQPYRVVLTALPDEPPKLDVAMKGIGHAITPEAILPIHGTLSDDYGVAKTWFLVKVLERREGSKSVAVDDPGREFAFPTPKGESVEAALDLQQWQQAKENPFKLSPDEKIEVTILAADRFNLNGDDQPNVGEGGKVTLEVVDSARFQQLLDASELSLRRRFEQMFEEMSQARDSLARVKADFDGNTGPLKGVEPEDVLRKPPEGEAAGPSATNPDGDEGEVPLDPAQASQRAAGLRMLRVQRGYQHSERAAGEVGGVAVQFEDLHDELVNNRIQAADRQERYKKDLAEPLFQIAQVHLPELTRRLRELELKLNDPKLAPAEAQAALDQADLVLLEMNKVLQKMLEFETYNELVEILRKLIADEDELIEDTRQQNKRRVLGEDQP